MAKKFTRKQAALVAARVADPLATQRELADKLGTTRTTVAKELAKPHIKAEICALMDERPKLKLGAMLDRLEEGVYSTKVQSVKLVDSAISVETEVPDFAVSHKWWESAMKMRGALTPDASESISGPINLAIILAGGGSDVERKAMAEVLEAAAITRGLK